MDHTAATAQTLDLHRLELRYAELRVLDTAAITHLAQSIALNGQLVPCIAVAGEGNSAILLDGYRRVAALRQLGKDTAEVECWDGDPVQGLLGVLARTRSRAFAPIEEALLLRELIASAPLSQHEIARRCGRDVSWVSRRLQLVTVLSDAVLTAVRQGKVSTWAAVRILGPLARANSAHAERLLESLRTTPLTTRQLATWFDAVSRRFADGARADGRGPAAVAQFANRQGGREERRRACARVRKARCWPTSAFSTRSALA
jgi:ParB family chromosome partitioning protein